MVSSPKNIREKGLQKRGGRTIVELNNGYDFHQDGREACRAVTVIKDPLQIKKVPAERALISF